MSLLSAFSWLIFALLDILWFLVIAQVIISWLIAFNIINTYQPFVHTVTGFLYQITEPLYRPIRRIIPSFNGIDLSPLILLLAIGFVSVFLQGVLPR